MENSVPSLLKRQKQSLGSKDDIEKITIQGTCEGTCKKRSAKLKWSDRLVDHSCNMFHQITADG